MKIRKKYPSEHQIQSGIVAYLRFRGLLFCAVPNERTPTRTGNFFAHKAKLWQRGLEPGAPDLIILEPRNGYNGLIIECKARHGKLTEKQKEFAHKAKQRNYCSLIVRDVDQGLKDLGDYLDGPQGTR